MLSLLYSTALFLSNSAEAPRAPAYAPSFCRRTDCNCSPYRTASTQQNTLARRPLRPFPPAATPVALALLSTRSPVNTHAPSLGFSSRRRQPAFLPAAAPVANRSLIYVLTCHNTHTESRFLFTPSRRYSRYLPGRTTFTQKTLSHADPCALFRPPLRRSHSLSYRHAHLSTPTRRVSVSLRATAYCLSACRCNGRKPLSYRHAHLSTPARRVSVSLRAAASPLFCPPLCRLHSLSYLCPHLSQHALILVSSSRRCAD